MGIFSYLLWGILFVLAVPGTVFYYHLFVASLGTNRSMKDEYLKNPFRALLIPLCFLVYGLICWVIKLRPTVLPYMIEEFQDEEMKRTFIYAMEKTLKINMED